MKLSVWSSYYVDLSPEDAILELAKNGIHYTELSDEHALQLIKRGDNPEKIGREFGEFARKNGVEVLQGHLWLWVKLCSDVDNTVKTLCDWLDLFYAIGIKNAVLHCDRIRDKPDMPPEERIEENVKVLKRLTSHIEGRDINISLESINAPLLADTAELLIDIIHRAGDKNLSICHDTGHLNLCNVKDQEHFILTAGKYLKALHVADNDRTGDQHILPYGGGNVNFETVVRCLKEIGYDGLFNYEVPGERNCPLEIRAYKLEYIKKCFDYMMR